MTSSSENSDCNLSRFDHVEEPRLRRILEHWLALKGNNRLPPHQALDPIDIGFALNIIWLVEVENEPRDFRYRVIGDHIRTAYTENIAGKRLSEITDRKVLPRVLDYFSRAVDEPAVVHVVGRIYAEDNRPARGERILLPMSDGENGCRTAVRLLGATVHSWLDKGLPTGQVPDSQIRTFTPVDGRAAWQDDWLE